MPPQTMTPRALAAPSLTSPKRSPRRKLPALSVPGIAQSIYELPSPKSVSQSAIALSFAKAGSTMFFEILRALCEHGDLTFVNFTHAYFVNGIDPDRLPADEGKMYLPQGYCYAGFRSIPIGYDAPAVRRMKRLLVVRDMRDTLVSRYYSGAFTHPLPGTSLDDRYRQLFLEERRILEREEANVGVLGLIREYRTFWNRYRYELSREPFRIWRYEDVVYDKARWAREICECLGFSLDVEMIAEIAKEQDVFPEQEQAAFVRKVTPGDYKEKLAPEVVSAIDVAFSDYQRQFGYV